MQRNDLITLLSQKDNDPVVVDVNGKLLDVKTVSDGTGCIVLILIDDQQPDTDDSET